jgi:hypothetical protein
MAGYHFVIRNSKNTEDLGGMDFADDAAAVAFGNGVIRDLMHWAAKPYAGWTMEIMENIDLIETAGPMMAPRPFQHDPASCHPAIPLLQLGHVLLNRSVDLGCSAHALEIDLNGRLHDPHPSVEGGLCRPSSRPFGDFPF